MIKYSKKVYSWLSAYIKYSFHVAASATALLWVTHIDFNQPIGLFSLLWFFVVVVLGYNFLKQNAASFERVKKFIALAIMSILLMALILISSSLKVLLFALFSFLLVLFYHKNRYQRWVALRKYPLIKFLVIALVWTFFSLIFVKLEARMFQIYALERFLWVIVWLIPFELRDLYLEKAPQPNRYFFSEVVLKILGFTLIAFILVLNYHNPTLHSNQHVFYAIMIFLTLGIYFSSKKRSIWYSLFWIEAIPILWWLLYVLMGM